METKKSEEQHEFGESASRERDGNISTSSNNNSDDESVHFPAISPVSNISSSSGIFSCGSASSSNFASKPTTPTNLQLTDKSDDDFPCSINSNNKISANEISVKDNAIDIGALAISKRCDSEQIESDNKNNRRSISASTSSKALASASTPKGVKIRSKHRQSRKHISLDDEIVIYESDSSLQIDPRRRNIHAMYSNRSNHQMNRAVSTAISRRKSEENSTTQPSNNIVSILKRKDSSTSSNASLVTFSPNVIDIEPTCRRPSHRQGILKKRSSLDESLRYSRSHSPSSASSESEKGCLVKGTRRRNSSEEINHHGILKQKSYDSSGGGSAAGYSSGIGTGGYNTPSSGVQGILKKPSLTPSDLSHEQPTKHVSISEAVILAAAELCKDMIIIDDGQSESYIKPILKIDNEQQQERRPKPILKKNHSSENEEIRSILKSRKSSREESFQDDL
jgi:hypothetical protein